MSASTYDPDSWLLSLQRALGEQVKSDINQAFKDGNGDDAGEQAFEVILDWPESDDVAKFVQLKRTVIHIAVDDIANSPLGMGDGIVSGAEVTTTDPDTVTLHEGFGHIVNFDVGVWASDLSGGHTSRMLAYQTFQQLFGTGMGKERVRAATQGVEIIRFNGGRFITDRVNDVRVFRIIDTELVVRVYSRVVSSDPVVIVDTEPVQEPDLEIDGLHLT